MADRHIDITIGQDIMAIKKILSNDTKMNDLGYTADNIYQYNILDEELDKDSMYIILNTLTPKKINQGDTQAIMIYGITIAAHRYKFDKVTDAVSRIQQLLHKKNISKFYHELELYDPPTEVSTIPEMTMFIMTFSCYVTI